MQEKKLKNYILKKNKTEAKRAFFAILLFITSLWAVFFWSAYIVKSQDIANSLSFGLTNSLVIGNTFYIDNTLNSLKMGNNFDYIKIISQNDLSKEKHEVFSLEPNHSIDNTLVKITDEYSINSNFVFLYHFPLQSNEREIGELILGKKLDIFLIFTSYFLCTILSFIIYFYKKKRTIQTYKKITDPIFNIEENIKKGDLFYNKISEFIEINNLYSCLCKYNENILTALNTIKEREKEIEKMSHFKSMVDTIKMIIHDVNKPYTLILSLLTSIDKIKNKDEQNKLIKIGKQEIHASLEYIQNIFKDIIYFGEEVNCEIQSISPTHLLDKSLVQIFSRINNTSISISWDLKHKYSIKADEYKILRVLNNIFDNAIKAMNKIGSLKISTQEIIIDNNRFIEFSIINCTSSTLHEDPNRVFDKFYTKGKNSGTGLGLAIVKQIVESHKGTVNFSSTPQQNEVELTFTIPSCQQDDSEIPNIELFDHSSLYKKIQSHEELFHSEEICIYQKINHILANNKESAKEFIILHIDDDISYLNYIEILCQELLHNIKITVISKKDPFEGLKYFYIHTVHFVLCDIDLNHSKINGYDIAKKIRNSNSEVKIYLHSNRIGDDILKQTFESGADSYLAKPMESIHILKIVLNHLEKNEQLTIKNSAKPVVIVIDDDEFYLDCWKYALHDSECYTFSDPGEAFEFLINNLDKVKLIIADYFFCGDKKNIIEHKFVAACRDIGYHKSILLSSSLNVFMQNEVALFDGVLEKIPISYAEIKDKFPHKFN
ncbi:hybrid sensor histidine kinase/response regulator [Fluviispira vulneris]|uniref:hybrid sensor histidine kinase/response regulator n=1 Tax=Fluviispira vulneris TaxID=2763012 RepID=UPI001646A88C|nr:hybrid sensor histidine kinase/response regulator [Fluviispira vulneris]